MQNRRRFLSQLTLATTALTIARPFNSLANFSYADGSGGNFKPDVLTILHSANLDQQWSPLGIDEDFPGLGGMNAMSKAIREVKQQNSNLLLVDTGNILSSSSQGTFDDQLNYYGKMSRLGYDAITPGHTDIKKGTEKFTHLLKESKLKAVAHNCPNQNDVLQPFKVVTKGNIKVGIIGMGSSKTEGFFTSEISPASINKTARTLKESHNCSIVICLAPTDASNYFELATQSSHIDVVLGSGNKCSLYNSRIVLNKQNHEVIVSNAGPKGTTIGRIDIECNNKQEKVRVDPATIYVGLPNTNLTASLKKYNYFQA